MTLLRKRLGEAFVTFDLDNDSGRGNETDYDMTLRGAGGPGVPYRQFVHKYPALRGNTKFEATTRNTTDINAIPVLKQSSHLPVIL